MEATNLYVAVFPPFRISHTSIDNFHRLADHHEAKLLGKFDSSNIVLIAVEVPTSEQGYYPQYPNICLTLFSFQVDFIRREVEL